MNALNQYINLYKNNISIVNDNSAPVINSRRAVALDALENMTLPKKGTENFEITDLQELLSPDYGINLARVNIDVNPAASFRCDVPNMSTALALLINDTFSISEVAEKAVPEGIKVMSLRRAALEMPELIEKHYNKIAPVSNPIVALNTLLVQDGCLIYIPKGCKADRPIQLVNILNHGIPLMAIRRVLIIAEEDSEASVLLCDHTQNPELRFLNLQVIEVYAENNANLQIYDLEESTPLTTRLSSLYLQQEASSKVLIDGITLYNGTTRNEYYTRFMGEDASLQLFGMGIEDNQRHLDTYSHICHDVPRCKTNELFKYVVDNEARGAFTGRIYVAEGAYKTEAYQSNRNIVGAPSAKMYAKPQLEIYNDDVKCSHGTAIGQLDELQLFYMRTRGIAENTAKLLLKQAFMMDVIDAVQLPALRERLRHLVECRFEGRESACANCSKGTVK